MQPREKGLERPSQAAVAARLGADRTVVRGQRQMGGMCLAVVKRGPIIPCLCRDAYGGDKTPLFIRRRSNVKLPMRNAGQIDPLTETKRNLAVICSRPTSADACR